MRRILNFRRSHNFSVVYMVIQDDEKKTMEVWQCDANSNSNNLHCKTFDFEPTSDSRAHAQLRAKTLATAMSRLSVREALRQMDNIRVHGEVR